MQQINECFNVVKKDYLNYLEKEKIFYKSKKKIINLKNIYIPMSFWIEKEYQKKERTLFLGLSGGQGSGKTTITGILKIILKKYFKRKIKTVSIDDFYKTLRERKNMSKKIHPLFKTRGVPGTHDTSSIKNFFIKIKKKRFKKFKIPKFAKNLDDRLKKKYWYNVNERPEIVILEGWCVGAKSQSQSLIKKPINDLEKSEDKQMIWRKHVNHKLKNDYKKIFSKIDHFIFIKIPNFKVVFKWRFLQESKLRKNSHLNNKTMSYNEIKRFIMFYERITLQMIKDLSKSASMLMMLKKNQEVKKIFFRSL